MTLKEMKKELESSSMLDGSQLQKLLMEIIIKLDDLEKRIPVKETFRI